jgi:hypothetical protein
MTGERLPSGAGYDTLLQLMEQTQLSDVPSSGKVMWPDQRVFSAAVTPLTGGGWVIVLHDVSHLGDFEPVKNDEIHSYPAHIQKEIQAGD